jgi:aminoglycoside phosphotransferase (APT) family kinase protein
MSTAPAWTPERTTTPERAAGLIASLVPELRGLPVVPLSEGWDNTVFRVGEWIARFPRRAMALPGFGRELAVLPRVAGRLPLPVPEPRWTGTDDDPREPWPFAVVRGVPGRELAEVSPPDAARVPAAAALGSFLAVLHAPETRAAVDGLDLPVDPMRRGDPTARVAQTRAQFAALVEQGLWTPDPAVDALLDDGARLAAPSEQPVLVHGDLHVRHLLLDGDLGAAGVIDWGDVCLADPAVDLAMAYAAFGGPARATLLDAYGGVDAERELRARCLAVRLSALLAGYAAAADDRPTLRTEALAGIGRAVA